MARDLNRKVGEMTFDGLIADYKPAVIVGAGTIKQVEEETTYERGTVLGFKEGTPEELYIMDNSESITPSCILCDDTVVSTDGDVTVPVYTMGCFNANKLITKDEYTLSAKDIDTLRKYGIYIKAAAPAV